jgi:hypothetical protein
MKTKIAPNPLHKAPQAEAGIKWYLNQKYKIKETKGNNYGR